MEPRPYQNRLHKFSCKPPGHDAARQRENQRRHRARVKGRIAELEASLLRTQSRLDDALGQIESLTAEVRRLRQASAPDSRSPSSVPTAAQPPPPPAEPATCPEHGAPDPAESDGATPSALDSARSPAEALPPVSTAPSGEEASVVTSEPMPSASGQFASGFESVDADCTSLPPPSAGESTIPCREAYSIIRDRTLPEFDLATATEWLKPGFRRAVVPSTGCRVQTHILFAFVDHITSI